MNSLSRLIISIIVSAGCTAASAIDLDSSYIETIRRGISLSMTEEFDSARALFEPLIEKDSTDYSAYFFLAAVHHSEMMDAEDFAAVDTFESLLDAAYRHAETAIEGGDNPAWALFIQGSTHAYRAALEGHIGSWFGAMKQAVKGKNRCLDALRIDPGLYDAYVVLGNYHYWKSSRTEFINWLPLVADRKEQGIEELRLAGDSALVSRDLALNSLVWVLLDHEQAKRALEVAEELHSRYPDSRLADWAMAFASYQSGQLHRATTYFESIIDQLEPDTTQNYYNLIECRYHLAEIYHSVGETELSFKHCEKALKYPVGEEVARRQKEKIQKLEGLLKQISEKQ